MPEAADMVIEGAQLVENVIRRAGENEAGVDRVGDSHRARIDVAAVARLDAAGPEPRAAHLDGLRALRHRRVTRRVHELRRYDARGAAVTEDLVGTPLAFLSGVADPN